MSTVTPKQLLISPHSIQVLHSTRGEIIEVFCPEGIETALECYQCPDPACGCPDDYYLDVSIKIPKAEYERIRQLPGWNEVEPEYEEKPQDD